MFRSDLQNASTTVSETRDGATDSFNNAARGDHCRCDRHSASHRDEQPAGCALDDGLCGRLACSTNHRRPRPHRRRLRKPARPEPAKTASVVAAPVEAPSEIPPARPPPMRMRMRARLRHRRCRRRGKRRRRRRVAGNLRQASSACRRSAATAPVCARRTSTGRRRITAPALLHRVDPSYSAVAAGAPTGRYGDSRGGGRYQRLCADRQGACDPLMRSWIARQSKL